MIDYIEIDNIPKHIGILIDGNRKWAKAKGLSKHEGHLAGAKNLQELCLSARDLGVGYLTTYVFSYENWDRPEEEVKNLLDTIMSLFSDYRYFVENNIKVNILGLRTNLGADFVACINTLETETRSCSGLTLSIAFNYSGKDEIVRALNDIFSDIRNGYDCDQITDEMICEKMMSNKLPNPDLIIRTSGVKRLTKFLLWRSSDSELIFRDKYWPDFQKSDLVECISIYQNRIKYVES